MTITWKQYQVERWYPHVGTVRRWGFRAFPDPPTPYEFVVEPNLEGSGWVVVTLADDNPVDVHGPYGTAEEAKKKAAGVVVASVYV